LEEVAVQTSLRVLIAVEENSALIVGDPQGILVEQLKPHPICY
jgi:hypothetical protein